IHTGTAPRFAFEHTEMWDRAARLSDEVAIDPRNATTSVGVERVLEEVCITGRFDRRAQRAAVSRHVALTSWRRAEPANDERFRHIGEEDFRRAHGLYDPGDVARWIAENGLTVETFQALMYDEGVISAFAARHRGAVTAGIHDWLRVSGHFSEIMGRV